MSRRPKNHVLLVQASDTFKPQRMHEMPTDGQITAIKFLVRHVTRNVAVNFAREYNAQHIYGSPGYDGSWAMVTVSLRRQHSYGWRADSGKGGEA